MTSVAEIAEAKPAPEAAAPPATGAYGFYVTFMLALVFMLAAADQNIMSIVLVPIQQELGVSDTAMGALTGTSFAIVYATASLPLARIADRGNRRNLIAIGVLAWSVFTAACGLATSYVTLLLARMGVAAGGAGNMPASMSMVGDLYPRSRRGIAVGCITMGSAIGIGVGAALAGLLSDLYGWRAAFLAMGAPGVFVTLLLVLTVREPPRGFYEGGAAAATPAAESSWTTAKYLAGVPSVRRLLAAKLVLQLSFGGFLVWAPAFFMRVHGLTTSQMSAGFGLVVASSAVLSAIMAGLVSDRLARSGERWRAYYCAAVLACGVPFAVLTVMAPTPTLAFGSLFLMSLITGGATSASITAGLGVVRPATRGFMTAILSFIIAVIGGGAGPILFGAITDAMNGRFGDQAIRFTLLTVPALWALASLLFWFAGRSTDRDAAAALGHAHEA